MGIVLAVKKNDSICIASDSMYVIGGSTKLTGDQVVNSEKLLSGDLHL